MEPINVCFSYVFSWGLAFCTCYTLKNKQMESINVCFPMFFFSGGLAFCTCYTLKNKQMESINVCFPMFFSGGLAFCT